MPVKILTRIKTSGKKEGKGGSLVLINNILPNKNLNQKSFDSAPKNSPSRELILPLIVPATKNIPEEAQP
jgi:hypothetical protein